MATKKVKPKAKQIFMTGVPTHNLQFAVSFKANDDWQGQFKTTITEGGDNRHVAEQLKKLADYCKLVPGDFTLEVMQG